MRTLSLILLGIVLVAFIAQAEAGGKKSKKKELAEKFEKCILDAEEADPESDPDQNAEDCKASLSKSGGKGDGDILGGMMDKFKGAVNKVKESFGKVGKKGKEFVGKVKGKLDELVKGFA